MTSVIDTSAFMRLFIPDGPVPDGLEEVLRAAERGDDVLLAPELLLAEVAQVIHRKRLERVLTGGEFTEVLDAIDAVPLRRVGHSDLMRPACEIALVHRLTVYDALFLALADNHNAHLYTADSRLTKVAKRMGL